MGRALKSTFLNKFLENRSLSPILNAVHNDTTLSMELRGKEVKIYYRGRLLITIKEGSCNLECNNKYWNGCYELLGEDNHKKLVIDPSVLDFIHNLPIYKAAIDYYLGNGKYLEEQAKQQLVLENNILGINNRNSKSGDYFILDTEYVENEKENINARFDAIALKWPSNRNDRKRKDDLEIAFLEMKYNEKAKKGDADILKHIDDYKKFIETPGFTNMCEDMQEIFKQKCKLGLIPKYNQSNNGDIAIRINKTKSEMIFLFANSDPESKIDEDEWKKIAEKYRINDLEDVYIARSSELGYMLFRIEKNGDDRYEKIIDYYQKKYPHIHME